jgi:cytochrome c
MALLLARPQRKATAGRAKRHETLLRSVRWFVVRNTKSLYFRCTPPLFMAGKVFYGLSRCGRTSVVRGHANMKRTTLLSAIALASLVTVSACGGGAEEAAAPAPTEEAATEEAPAEEAAGEEEAPAEEAAATPAAATAGFAGMTTDVKAGERVFALCRSCHVLEEGQNRVGPSLHNIVGRKSGSVAGFNYSDANKNSGVTWTTDVLFEYLEDPKGFMPGTKMAFPGIKNPQDRANLIAYLESTKS